VANVFVSGGTGYLGLAAIPQLVARGHKVTSLVRPGSERKAPCPAAIGNALDAATFPSIAAYDTFIHLTGTPKPAPWKGAQFRAVDQKSLEASVAACRGANIRNFVYVSVAHPAPVMRAYIAVRLECEAHLEASGMPTTILRPWYILGPGHRWATLLRPLYAVAERVPSTRDGALRCGMITLDEMVCALLWSVENPPTRSQVLTVLDIRAMRLK
jgi:uncharacterized protein YbjT (DUF2867 family)